MKKIIIFLLLPLFFLDAQNYHPKYSEGMNSFNAGKYREAEQLFTEALVDDFYDAEIYYMRGLSILYQNRFEDAINDFNETIALDPNHSDAYNSRGLCYSYINQLIIAMPDFNKAIELDPEFASAYINRASLYISNKEFDKAEADLNKALSLNKDNPELYVQRGRLYHLTGKYDEAIKDFSNVLRKGVRHNKIYYNRANSYFRLGEFEKAVQDYSKALELDPQDNESLNNRAIAYDELGMDDLASADRELLFEKLGIDYQSFDDVKFKQYSSSNGELQMELPDNWHSYEVDIENGYNVFISRDSFDPRKQVMRIGVNITVERNMYERYDLGNDDTVLEFWKGSQKINSYEYHSYKIKSKKEKLFHGYPSSENLIRIQAEPDYPEFEMYEFVIAYRGNLIYMYFQAPVEEFVYFDEIFRHAISSIRLNPDAAEK